MCNARCRKGKKEGCRVITRGNVFAREPTNHVPVNFFLYVISMHRAPTRIHGLMSYTHLTCICICGWLNAGFELFGHGHSHLATLLPLNLNPQLNATGAL